MTLSKRENDVIDASAQIRRVHCSQQPKWQRFRTTLNISTAGCKQGIGDDSHHPYLRQYSHVYHQRLAMLSPWCWNVIQNDETIHVVKASLHGNDESCTSTSSVGCNAVYRVDRILELRENRRSVAVGTLVKESSSSAWNYTSSSSRADPLALHPKSCCLASDQLFLEDESGRVAIEFSDPLEKHKFCSGLVVGIMGIVGVDGVMVVEKLYMSTTLRIPTKKLHSIESSPAQRGSDPCLLLLSGLHCGSYEMSSLSREMLLSFLQGSLGAVSKAAQISHVICAGGLIDPPSKSLESERVSSTVYGCNDLDAFCFEVAQKCALPITLLPGSDDPTTASWPQRPLHHSLLPFSLRSFSGYSSLVSTVPNPYSAIYKFVPDGHEASSALHDKCVVVGTDGRNIADLVKRLLVPLQNAQSNPTSSTSGEGGQETVAFEPFSELAALEMTLRCGHICPTGPDTVPTIPHGPENPDPMVLLRDDENVIPSLYFCGNCTTFATKLVQTVTNNVCRTTRLVCIPKFTETGETVLINLRSLRIEVIRFEE